MPPNVIEDAICIRQWDFSETSQTVSLFTRGRGVVRGLAKGSRRAKAPFSGGIELLTRGMAGLIVKGERGGGGGGERAGSGGGGGDGGGLALITEWDLTAIYPGLRRRLAAYHAGLYMADLVHHMVTDHDPHERLFEAMAGGLEKIGGGVGGAALRTDVGGSALRADANGQGDDVGGALLTFQWAALVETGYKPELDADVQTGEALAAGGASPRGVLLFSPSLGGVVTAERESGADEPAGHAWRVRAETIDLLRKVAGTNGDADAVLAKTPPATILRANRLLAAYIRHTLGREPRSMPVVFGARLPR